MKHFLLIAILASMFSATMAFAEESNTDCPSMAEENSRHNPKSSEQKKKEQEKAKSTTKQ